MNCGQYKRDGGSIIYRERVYNDMPSVAEMITVYTSPKTWSLLNYHICLTLNLATPNQHKLYYETI